MLKKAYSKNYHHGFLDMDVVYEKRRARQEKLRREKEAELQRIAAQKQKEKEDLEKFV